MKLSEIVISNNIVPILYHGTCQENANLLTKNGWNPNLFSVGGDINGSWDDPTNMINVNTALESNISATTYENGIYLGGPYLVEGGDRGNSTVLNTEKGLRIPFIENLPVVLCAQSIGSNASVTCSFKAIEQW